MNEILLKLERLYQESIEDKSTVRVLNDYLWSSKAVIDFYLDTSVEQLKDDQSLIDGLSTILKCLRYVYTFSGLDLVTTDPEYDILVDKFEILCDQESPISDPDGNVHEKGFHLYPSLRGTLDKVYFLSKDEKIEKGSRRRSLTEWLDEKKRKIEANGGELPNLMQEEIYVFPKWDGVSVVFEFDKDQKLVRALTRGYTKLNEAMIVTSVFAAMDLTHIKTIKNNGLPYGVKTEVMTTMDGLTEYNNNNPNKKYKNTRSFASALLNQEVSIDPILLQRYLKIIPLRVSFYTDKGESLQELHPRVGIYPYIRTTFSDTEQIDDFAERSRMIDGLRCDGIVFYIINKDIQNILGRENDRQKFEVAYKFTEESTYAKVKGINFSVGLYGNITPVLEIKPVTLKGNLITHISLGSIGIMEDMNLGKGDIIKVSYDIIPVCSFNERDPKCIRGDKKRFHAPDVCPICGQDLTRKNGLLFCGNNKCPSKVMGKILNHIRVMNINHIGRALLEQLYREGLVSKIQDLYKLPDKKEELLSLENFGKKKFARLKREINDILSKDIDEARVCESLSIEGLGYSTFRTIFQHMNLEDLLVYAKNEDYVPLVKIHGIGKVKAHWIIEALREKSVLKTLEYLQSHLNIIPMKNSKPSFRVAFSSFQNGDPRKERVIELTKERNGEVSETINSGVDILVVPQHGVGTRKEQYAKDHGIKICTPELFIESLKA